MTLLSESCPLHQKSVCDLCSGATGVSWCSQLCWGDTEPQSHSHSASGALAPEPDPESLLYPVREIIFPKTSTPVAICKDVEVLYSKGVLQAFRAGLTEIHGH